MEIPLRGLFLLDTITLSDIKEKDPNWILENDEELQKIQTELVVHGNDFIYAPTFFANSTYLTQQEVIYYNRKIVENTRKVAKQLPVAGVLSTSNCEIAPFGETSFTTLLQVYKQQAEVLSTIVDLFAIEGNRLVELRAAVLACKEYKKPIFVSVDVTDDVNTASCLVTLQNMGIDGFSINCENDIEATIEQLDLLMPFATVPIIVKQDYFTPAQYDELKSAFDMLVEQSGDIVLASENQVFILFDDKIEFTQPIHCEHDMTDELLAVEHESYDVILTVIENADDAMLLSQNAHLAMLPIALNSDNELALNMALMLYNGRCMIDSRCEIDDEVLRSIAKKYGAVIY